MVINIDEIEVYKPIAQQWLDLCEKAEFTSEDKADFLQYLSTVTQEDLDRYKRISEQIDRVFKPKKSVS